MNITTRALAHIDVARLRLQMSADASKAIRQKRLADLRAAGAVLTKLLRGENNPDPDWARYPLARDWFTQSA